MEQGVICMGPATRQGCGYRCIKGNSPCKGCYGPVSETGEQGTKMMSAISSIIDAKEPEEIEKIIEDDCRPCRNILQIQFAIIHDQEKTRTVNK